MSKQAKACSKWLLVTTSLVLRQATMNSVRSMQPLLLVSMTRMSRLMRPSGMLDLVLRQFWNSVLLMTPSWLRSRSSKISMKLAFSSVVSSCETMKVQTTASSLFLNLKVSMLCTTSRSFSGPSTSLAALIHGCSKASLAEMRSSGFLVSMRWSSWRQPSLYLLPLRSSLSGGSEPRMRCMTSTSLSPLNGGRWVSIIYMITPVDQTSHFSSYFFSSTSGATQYGVPTRSVSFSESCRWCAMPKSMILTTMLLRSNSMFSGLRSRWTTPTCARQSSTFSICLTMRAMYSSGSSLLVMIFLKSSPPSQSSRMRTQCDLQSQTSQRRMMLMWSSDFIMAISMNSFSCYCFPSVDFLIRFAARNSPVYFERTLLTLPNPPRPTSFRITQSSRQLRFFILMKLFHRTFISSHSAPSAPSACSISRYSSSFICRDRCEPIAFSTSSSTSPSSTDTGAMYLKTVLLPGFEDFSEDGSGLLEAFTCGCSTVPASFPILLLQIIRRIPKLPNPHRHSDPADTPSNQQPRRDAVENCLRF